ncbi:MAG TPA: ion channel [Kofleriaceae bacterium]|jgi:hypothetical protein|nr:ion channel [Kofleriaceae bacterium]
MLTFGAAMILHPVLGSAVVSQQGQTATDFFAALIAAGRSLSIVGAGEFSPRTGGARLFFLFNSVVGTAIISLTLTYLMQVYNSLKQRNALGMTLHLMTMRTGDAAELVAGLGPDGQFSTGYGHLIQLANQMTEVEESHHFYPVLLYFRFHDPFYSVSEFAFVALDALSLTETALSEEKFHWLKHSAAVAALWQST